MNEQEIKKPTLKIFLVKDDIRLGDVVRMWSVEPSSDQPEKPAEASQPINVQELLGQELDRLADEANRGEWDTLPNEMKYLKRKQYDTLLSYITLLDQLAECEAKNAELKRRNEL